MLIFGTIEKFGDCKIILFFFLASLFIYRAFVFGHYSIK